MNITKIESNELVLMPEVIQELIKFEEQKKAIDIREKEIKEAILTAMENNNIKKFENELINITYVEPITRVGVDSDKLKTEYEEIYLSCLKESSVKASIRIKVKNEK